MTDFLGYIFQGLWVGIGMAGAEWVKEAYIKPYLDRVHGNMKGHVKTIDDELKELTKKL